MTRAETVASWRASGRDRRRCLCAWPTTPHRLIVRVQAPACPVHGGTGHWAPVLRTTG